MVSPPTDRGPKIIAKTELDRAWTSLTNDPVRPDRSQRRRVDHLGLAERRGVVDPRVPGPHDSFRLARTAAFVVRARLGEVVVATRGPKGVSAARRQIVLVQLVQYTPEVTMNRRALGQATL